MVFSNRLAKFGKGSNLSAIMNEKDKISIFFFRKGISKKDVFISDTGMTLSGAELALGFNEVIPVDDKHLVSRLDKSIGVIEYGE